MYRYVNYKVQHISIPQLTTKLVQMYPRCSSADMSHNLRCVEAPVARWWWSVTQKPGDIFVEAKKEKEAFTKRINDRDRQKAFEHLMIKCQQAASKSKPDVLFIYHVSVCLTMPEASHKFYRSAKRAAKDLMRQLDGELLNMLKNDGIVVSDLPGCPARILSWVSGSGNGNDSGMPRQVRSPMGFQDQPITTDVPPLRRKARRAKARG